MGNATVRWRNTMIFLYRKLWNFDLLLKKNFGTMGKKYFTSVYANRLLLWVQICDATGCFVKALLKGQNIVIDKTYTKQLGLFARFSQFKVNKKQKQ